MIFRIQRVRRIFTILLLLILAVYISIGAVLFFFQESLIFYPDKTDFTDCPDFADAEKVSFGSMRAYFISRSKENIVVFYHGNAGRACDRSYLDSSFAKAGYSVLFVEYSGFAEAGGPSMVRMLQNVDDTVGFLATTKFNHVVVIGESIGTGPASYHASRSKSSKIILITPFTNLADVAFSHYPVFPMRLMLKNNVTPDKWLSDYKGPVSLILAGNDEVVTERLGQKLYDGLTSDNKKIYVIQDAGHNTISQNQEFYSVLQKELEE